MKIMTSYPHIQALHDLARLSMRMKSGGNFGSADPMNTNKVEPGMIATEPQSGITPHNHVQQIGHIQPGAVAPAGKATAELNASQNPERFLSVMKNMNIKKNRGIAM